MCIPQASSSTHTNIGFGVAGTYSGLDSGEGCFVTPATQSLSTTSPRSRLLFLQSIVTNDLLYDLIFDACTARSLVRLLQTCHTLRLSVQDYIPRRFNITKLLSRYFHHPETFRHLQAATGTIISGSSVLQFFDRSYYAKSDLDLYVPLAWRAKVGQYLLKEGYSFVATRTQSSLFADAVDQKRVITNNGLYGNFKGIAAVFTFKKRSGHDKQLQVQVIVAVRSPMEVVLKFHSSTLCSLFLSNNSVMTKGFIACVMNIITFNQAHCLYPRATLEERLSLVCTDRQDEVIERVYERYHQRGWSSIYEHIASLDAPKH